jgi:hypothetical protein
MNYYIDTEFYERPNSVELISIGVVSETGERYYAETLQAEDLCDRDEWLRGYVLPTLKLTDCRSREKIKQDLLSFIDPSPVFYGYYCAYDWVVFCWIFGRMVDLPEGYPMYCRDLKQMADEAWLGPEDVELPLEDEHNALADALINRKFHRLIIEKQGGLELVGQTVPGGERRYKYRGHLTGWLRDKDDLKRALCMIDGRIKHSPPRTADK